MMKNYKENDKWAVTYSPNENEIRYVGSVNDYKDGGFVDPILMGKQEAESLLEALDHYVRNEEKFFDKETALWAYEHKEWGFGIEELYTYDVYFHDDNNKGWHETYEKCLDYIKANNGSNTSYFADYKGGTVAIFRNETEEEVYWERIGEVKHLTPSLRVLTYAPGRAIALYTHNGEERFVGYCHPLVTLSEIVGSTNDYSALIKKWEQNAKMPNF